MTSTAIEVQGLYKTYGDFEAVRGIDLTVDEGEVFAFLGPNGAGKTTTVEILEGYRQRTRGDVRVLGVDPASAPLEWRERVGIVLQSSKVEPQLTVHEALELHGRYYRAPRPIDETIELVGLGESSAQRIARLSGGQQRRLDLALALIGDPDLVFLDEPTTGFDPSARRDSWEMIERLRELGTTVFLTTHYMDEAESLADRLAIIARGEIIATGTTAELARAAGAVPHMTWCPPRDGEVPPEFADRIEPLDNGYVRVEILDGTRDLHHLTTWAIEQGADLSELQVLRPTLEDVYLRLTAETEAHATESTKP